MMIWPRTNADLWRATICGALGWLFLPLMASAGEPLRAIDIAGLPTDAAFTPTFQFVENIDPGLAPEDVIASAGTLDFKLAHSKPPQFSAWQSDVWLRFALKNSGPDVQSAKFALRFPYLQRTDLFEIRPDGSLHQSTAGSAVAVTGSGIAAAYPAYHLLVPPGESREYFVRVRSSSLIVLPAVIASEANFARHIAVETLIWSLIIGAALSFAVYAGSMSFAVADGSFRIYICFALSVAIYILLSSGLVTAIFGMHLHFNFGQIVFFTQAMMMAFGTMFIMVFLDMEKQAPRLYRVFYAIAFISTLTAISAGLPSWIGRVSFYIATGAGPVILVAGLAIMSSSGISGARSALIAWLPCLLATVWVHLRMTDMAPYLPINLHLLPLAFAFMLAYLSAVLGGRARQAEFWSNADAMTGLGNRRLLDRICELENRQTSERYGAAVIIPFLSGRISGLHAASFSFMAGVMPPMPMFGRWLL